MTRDLDPPPTFAADPGGRPPSRGEARAGLAGLVLSLTLHAAPALLLLNAPTDIGPVSAGEHAVDIELVAAEALGDALHLDERPPVPDVEFSLQAPSPNALARWTQFDDEPQSLDETAFPTPPPIPDPVVVTQDQPDQPAVDAAAAFYQPEASPLEQRSAVSEGYQAAIAKHLARFRRFPKAMPRSVNAARVVLSFEIDLAGTLTSAKIVESSGFPLIDEEALAMVRRAQPFPAAGNGRTTPARFTIPVTYRIRVRG